MQWILLREYRPVTFREVLVADRTPSGFAYKIASWNGQRFQAALEANIPVNPVAWMAITAPESPEMVSPPTADFQRVAERSMNDLDFDPRDDDEEEELRQMARRTAERKHWAGLPEQRLRIVMDELILAIYASLKDPDDVPPLLHPADVMTRIQRGNLLKDGDW